MKTEIIERALLWGRGQTGDVYTLGLSLPTYTQASVYTGLLHTDPWRAVSALCWACQDVQ